MKYFGSFLVILLVFACERDEFTPADAGFDYMPLRVGDFRTYTVDEIVYSEVDEPETLRYELKTVVVDSFPASSGEITYVINRFRRDEGTTLWSVLENWSVRRNDRELIVSEGNTPFVKLTFPIRLGNEWNANEFNTQAEDAYTITSLGVAAQVDELQFDNSLTITQESNDDRIVFYDVREEQYAQNIGLISRIIHQLRYCTLDHCLGQQIIQSGREYRQKIKEYGRI